MNPSIEIRPVKGHEAVAACEPILRSVPEWFGIESSTLAYIADAARLPTWVARCEGRDAGFITLSQTSPHAIDVHCIAVHREFHGRGLGTTLIRHAETYTREQGASILHVKTMGPSRPNQEYARTTHFYRSSGFLDLEEVNNLWPGIPCLILVKWICSPSLTPPVPDRIV